MNISRRSFLKMAGLTTVAAAGAAVFTGCSLYNTVQMEFTSADKTVAADVLAEINKDAPSITVPSFIKEINGILKNTVNKAVQEAFKKAKLEGTITVNSIKIADDKMTIDVTADPAITKASK